MLFPGLGVVAFVAVEMKYPVLISFGAKLVLYVISTSLAGTVAIVSFVCGFATFIVVSGTVHKLDAPVTNFLKLLQVV